MRENDHQSYSGTAFRIYIFSVCAYDASLIYDHRAQTHASRFMTSFLIDEISLIIKCSVYAFDEVHFHYILEHICSRSFAFYFVYDEERFIFHNCHPSQNL